MSEGEFKKGIKDLKLDDYPYKEPGAKSVEEDLFAILDNARREFPLPYDAERTGEFSEKDKKYGESWDPKALAKWFLKWFGDIKK
jgi:hypothetical protein